MKIDGVPGTYYFQALLLKENGWELCGCYHGQRCDVDELHDVTAQWPVELMDGIVYIPAEEELQ